MNADKLQKMLSISIMFEKFIKREFLLEINKLQFFVYLIRNQGKINSYQTKVPFSLKVN